MTNVLSQPKWVGRSSTIWGAIIAVIATGYQVVGPIADTIGITIPVTPGDIQAANNSGAAIISGIGALAGLALTVWGRFKAGKVTQPVSVFPNAPKTTVTVVTPQALTKKASG